MQPVRYAIGDSGKSLIFIPSVLNHFTCHRQLKFWQSEAGGQLFARFVDNDVIVEHATGPRRTDRRNRTSYIPDRRAEQSEIDQFHKLGLHYIGDWHTHPEPIATPSMRDKRNMLDCFTKSTHKLRAFVMVIVGQKNVPESMHVSLHDDKECYRLQSNFCG